MYLKLKNITYNIVFLNFVNLNILPKLLQKILHIYI